MLLRTITDPELRDIADTKFQQFINHVLPDKFKNASLDKNNPKHVEAWNLLKNNSIDKKGLYLWGDAGTGKSHLTYSLVRQIYYNRAALTLCNRHGGRKIDTTCECSVHSNLEVKGQRLRAIIESLKPTAPVQRTAEYYINCDYLILDDIGREKLTDWALEQAELIIDGCYTKGTVMLTSSNRPVADLEDALGSPSATRIYEQTSQLHMTENWRVR